MLSRFVVGLFLTLGSVFVLGCGSTPRVEVPRYEVTGTVKFRGTALPEGSISFESVEDIKEGRGPAVGTIQNGQYTVRATAGKHRVTIRTAKASETEEMEGKPVKETIPAQYNSQSRLTQEVTSSGPNRADFDLK